MSAQRTQEWRARVSSFVLVALVTTVTSAQQPSSKNSGTLSGYEIPFYKVFNSFLGQFQGMSEQLEPWMWEQLVKKDFALDPALPEVQELGGERQRINDRVVSEYHSGELEDREVRERWAIYLGEVYERLVRAISRGEESPGSAELAFRARLRDHQQGMAMSWTNEENYLARLAELQDLFDSTVRQKAAENRP